MNANSSINAGMWEGIDLSLGQRDVLSPHYIMLSLVKCSSFGNIEQKQTFLQFIAVDIFLI